MLYFGVLKDLAGGREGSAELAAGSTVAGLLAVLARPEVAGWTGLAVAVNREYAGLGTVLRDGDEVALLPPVSGGAAVSQVSEARPGAPGSGGSR